MVYHAGNCGAWHRPPRRHGATIGHLTSSNMSKTAQPGSEPTFYFHDYETFGISPAKDRPSQFAGIRTDADFNIIGEPLVVYCKPPADYLPEPEACLITGITPQKAMKDGLCEADFIRRKTATPAGTSSTCCGPAMPCVRRG